MKSIDIVVMWVDGSDPAWIIDKLKHQSNSKVTDEAVSAAEKCFRDWDIMQYWFRGIEKYAPWVNRVHFVTYGHLPKWLNVDCKKLHIVNHHDFMPEEALPTFNSRALEINLHRIKGLSEQFIYFNDDMFLIKPIKPEYFFKENMPCDSAILAPIQPWRYGTGAIQVNDMEIVNAYFHDFEIFRKNRSKWLTPVYGGQLIRTLLLSPFRHMFGIYEPHLPASYLKSTFKKVWELEPELLMSTTISKFKNKQNINQWLMRYWQIASGQFVPRSPAKGKFYDISRSLEEICNTISEQKKSMICINDSNEITNITEARQKLVHSFESILPDKSSFEK